MATTDFERWLAGYQPRSLTDAQWQRVGPFVREQMLLLPRAHPHTEATCARLLGRITAWSTAHGKPMDPYAVLEPGNVERYLTAMESAHESDGDYRGYLRGMARVLAPAAWPPVVPPRNSRHLVAPYTPDEMCRIIAALGHQKDDETRRIAETIVALGHGAGLDGHWNTRVGPEDILVDGGVVLAAVHHRRPRQVVVTREWEDTVLRLAEEARQRPGEALVGPRMTGRNQANKLAARIKVRGGLQVSAPRLRSTWLVNHVNAGTNLRALLDAAGSTSASTVTDILGYADTLPPADARRQLREAVSGWR